MTPDIPLTGMRPKPLTGMRPKRARSAQHLNARAILLVALMTSVCLPETARSISIGLSFGGGVTAVQAAVFQEAAARWESSIVSNESFNVSVSTSGSLPSGLLALATGYTSTGGLDSMTGLQLGTPTGGSIFLATNAPFYVDPTPGDDVEFLPSGLSPTLLLADPADPMASGGFDLLSTAIHEIGHVLGFSSGFADFASHVQPTPSMQHNAFVFSSSATLGDPILDYKAGMGFVHGSALMPNAEPDAEEGGSVAGVPSHLDDVLATTDPAGGLFPYDAMTPSLRPAERRLISFVDLDILADAYGYTVVPEPGTALLIGLGLVGLARRGQRS